MERRSEDLSYECENSVIRNRIFLIGFNKCATTTFHEFCLSNNLRSLHWKARSGEYLAVKLLQNHALGRNALQGLEKNTAYCDITYNDGSICIEGCRFFRYIHRSYPDGYFILNTRPVEHWIRSRMNHADGDFLRRALASSGFDTATLKKAWNYVYQKHHQEVRAYFSKNPRFLEFDIEADRPEKICDFLSNNFSLDPGKWGHENRTRRH